MSFRSILLSAFAVAAVSGVVTPAAAEDFTLIVPVRLAALPPEIDGFRIQCGASELPVRVGATGTTVGGGISPVLPLSGGGFTGDVTIRFNASPTGDPARAATYSCWLRLNGILAGTRTEWYGTDGNNPASPMRSMTGEPPVDVPVAAGATIVHGVKGPLR
ncbi:MAG: hypothetical protein FJ191_00065 [Gammaproteobacteria bacterium]|nr:hypothetical protein [Gammaproteobacteria bacterium]